MENKDLEIGKIWDRKNSLSQIYKAVVYKWWLSPSLKYV